MALTTGHVSGHEHRWKLVEDQPPLLGPPDTLHADFSERFRERSNRNGYQRTITLILGTPLTVYTPRQTDIIQPQKIGSAAEPIRNSVSTKNISQVNRERTKAANCTRIGQPVKRGRHSTHRHSTAHGYSNGDLLAKDHLCRDVSVVSFCVLER